MAARRSHYDEADFHRHALRPGVDRADPRTQAIVAAALAKNGREASEMVGVGHAFRQRLKRSLAAVGVTTSTRTNGTWPGRAVLRTRPITMSMDLRDLVHRIWSESKPITLSGRGEQASSAASCKPSV
jgi:hypothetical protein